ncbi:uncharacterized protein STEHIDRAFT_159945 [Stereum hirsutum FP-91666 SS1]|uniref:uncharacterized protein n=1 Tax=Stereum hirsutum (strain FP-91666) TaxID=721885 RepID=UPI0004449B4A|nr:uncharacterized protein STEHIDRAFT_159945 [Stereum hirsutum FP-91666 SS1]EIM83360.1 hypothetical protein STEHIDRAFT_159945 [Stereum hirsutum FP-91666 SS1]
MDCLSFQLPQISISSAPPTSPPSAEPFSPFSGSQLLSVEVQDSYRPSLLSPPPMHPPKISSPLRPVDGNALKKGIDQDRFQALLTATKERNATSTSRKSADLRKEIALKTHKSKQMERRALFLSKVQAPPSPTATTTPKTPPESPAIFHYSLPSPGLVSPLALYESMNMEYDHGIPVSPWIEQVDFRLPLEKKAPSLVPKRPSTQPRTHSLPSLDEITARLSKDSSVPATRESSRPHRLPTFLRQEPTPKMPTIVVSNADASPAPTQRPRLNLPFGVSRQTKPSTPVAQSTRTTAERPKLAIPTSTSKACGPPASPRSPLLQVTTTIVPPSSAASPRNLTETNVIALNSRVRTARDMMSTLRRRMSCSPSDCGVVGHGEVSVEERKLRRISAPAELQRRERIEFAHPVLSMPGGF